MIRLALAFLLAMTLAATAAPRVATVEGPVDGFARNGVARFLGIPYAAPPVGPLRWTPPQPVKHWTGPRSAIAFAPICAQVTTLGPFAGPANANEDCLYLNVFAPGAAKKLPVLVWIHGGGYYDGASNDYDAARLAAQGKLVVVTLNYRLNLFGFLAHPALDRPARAGGNYGLMDVQEALRWVKRNIAAFGGDPGNVTLGGQSAGAGAASALMLAPTSRGLFHRAILMSGGYTPLIPGEVANKKGRDFAVAAGCGPANNMAQCLRALPATKVVALSGTASATSAFISGAMVDGRFVPRNAADAFAVGDFARMPVMVGTTRDEGNFSIGIAQYFRKERTPATLDDFKAYAARLYGGNAGPGGKAPAYPKGTVAQLLKLYDPARGVQAAWDGAHSDMLACRGQYLAKEIAPHAPVYAYLFDDRTAPSYFPQMPGFAAGAYHTADLTYLFEGYHGGPDGRPTPLNARQHKLADRMITAWSNFARSGNPNGGGNAPWPRWSKNGAAAFIQNDAWSQAQGGAQFSAAHHCDFWNGILLY